MYGKDEESLVRIGSETNSRTDVLLSSPSSKLKLRLAGAGNRPTLEQSGKEAQTNTLHTLIDGGLCYLPTVHSPASWARLPGHTARTPQLSTRKVLYTLFNKYLSK